MNDVYLREVGDVPAGRAGGLFGDRRAAAGVPVQDRWSVGCGPSVSPLGQGDDDGARSSPFRVAV